jgi:hypothetical protein
MTPSPLALLCAAAIALVATACSSTTVVESTGTTTAAGGHAPTTTGQGAQGQGGQGQGGGGLGGQAQGGHGQGGHGGSALPVGACRTDADCPDNMHGEFCWAPGESRGCGICGGPPEPKCGSDADCASQGAASICDPIPCPCSPDDKACHDGCTKDADCGVASVCGATHRCEPAPCGAGAACPALFSCDPGGHCARTTCTTDAACGDGRCVNGACWEAFGQCDYPAA